MDYFNLTGIVLFLSLGLRHGLDPDHIAAIDGMTFRSLERQPQLSRWIGTLFAFGHGLVVTVIAVVVSLLGQSFSLPEKALAVAGWIPVLLLLLIGTLNLRALFRDPAYQPVGWKTRFLPQRLREATQPWAIILVGVFFAVVFDTATQAVAWGYAATAAGGVSHALFIGAVFTFGMMVTDTIDNRLMCRVCRTPGVTRNNMQRYRRRVGWLIVFLSYGVAGYKIASHFFASLEVGATAYTLIGLTFLLAIPAYALTSRRRWVSA